MFAKYFPVGSVARVMIVQEGSKIDEDVVVIVDMDIDIGRSALVVRSLYTEKTYYFNLSCNSFLGISSIGESEVKRIKRIIEMQKEESNNND